MKTASRWSRRDFLKRTAIAAGVVAGFPTIIPASALGRNGRPAPSNRLNMACIGLGTQGMPDMRSFLGKPEVQMIAVCDVNRFGNTYGYSNSSPGGREHGKQVVEKHYASEMASGSYKGCATYEDFRELIARGDLDAVITAVPDHWHALVAIAAMRAGIDVFGEKPLARTVREARAICDAARKYGRVWQTDTWQRSTKNFLHACELVVNGRIGKLQRIEVGLPKGNVDFGMAKQTAVEPVPEGFNYDFWLGPAPVAPYCPARCHLHWRWIHDYGAGMLSDWGAHHIDIAHWGAGLDYTAPVEVTAKGDAPNEVLFTTPAMFEFTAKYPNGLRIDVSTKLENGTRFIGDKGWVFTTRGHNAAQPASLLKEVIGATEQRLYASDDHSQNFLDCVRTRRPTICPAAVSYHSILPALLAEIGMLTGRTIRWDAAKEEIVGDAEANRLLGVSYREPWSLTV